MWLKFADRCKYQTAVLIDKTMNNMVLSHITDMIYFSENKTHKLRSISNKDLVLKDILRINCIKNAFTYYSTSIWNDIPSDIRASLSVKTLKENIKHVYCSLEHYLFKLYVTVNYLMLIVCREVDNKLNVIYACMYIFIYEEEEEYVIRNKLTKFFVNTIQYFKQIQTNPGQLEYVCMRMCMCV